MKEIIYSFPADTSKPRPFLLQMSGISYCDGTYRIRRHDSPKYVLEYVTQGRGTVHVNDIVFHPKAGDVYFLHRGMDHDYYSDRKDPWIKTWFNVEGPLIDHLVEAYGLREVYHVENAGEGLLDLFLEGLRESRKHYLLPDKSGVHQSLALVVHRILMGLSEVGQTPTGSDIVRKMKAFIDHRFRKPVGLADISREAGRSPSAAIRLFKKETGMTPYDYLLERRVNEAKLLLRDTAIPIKVVAARTGFCDEFHFSAYFKRRTGLSPQAMRKKA